MTPDPKPRSVLIAGSGIVGAATAFFLAARGLEVALLDAEAPAAAATGAADGAVSVASKRPGPMMTAALSGVALYRALAEEGLLSGLFKQRSTFIVAASEAECAVLETHAAALKSVGVPVEMMSRDVLHRRFPVFSPAARMGAEVRGEGHAIGYQIVHRLLAASGIVVRRGVRAEGLLTGPDGRHVAGVATNRGEFRADAVVVATGGGTAALLGLEGVLKPRKGQLLVTERAPALNAAMPGAIMSGRYLLSKGSQNGVKTPSGRGYGLVVDPLVTGQFLIGGTREDSDARQSNDFEAVARILGDAVDLVPQLGAVRLLRAFAGVRTAVADGLPLVGRMPGMENLFVAAGFEGDGICLGPVMGRAISALVCGERPELDLSPFDPGRFAGCEVAA